MAADSIRRYARKLIPLALSSQQRRLRAGLEAHLRRAAGDLAAAGTMEPEEACQCAIADYELTDAYEDLLIQARQVPLWPRLGLLMLAAACLLSHFWVEARWQETAGRAYEARCAAYRAIMNAVTQRGALLEDPEVRRQLDAEMETASHALELSYVAVFRANFHQALSPQQSVQLLTGSHPALAGLTLNDAQYVWPSGVTRGSVVFQPSHRVTLPELGSDSLYVELCFEDERINRHNPYEGSLTEAFRETRSFGASWGLLLAAHALFVAWGCLSLFRRNQLRAGRVLLLLALGPIGYLCARLQRAQKGV